MKKLSVIIAGRHETSISLEDEFLVELKRIASEKGLSLNKLVTEIDQEKTIENLSSAIRVYVLKYKKCHPDCASTSGSCN